MGGPPVGAPLGLGGESALDVWRRFWVPRWIQGLGPIWGLGLQVGWWGFEQSCSRV